jgi:hypothetical protein
MLAWAIDPNGRNFKLTTSGTPLLSSRTRMGSATSQYIYILIYILYIYWLVATPLLWYALHGDRPRRAHAGTREGPSRFAATSVFGATSESHEPIYILYIYTSYIYTSFRCHQCFRCRQREPRAKHQRRRRRPSLKSRRSKAGTQVEGRASPRGMACLAPSPSRLPRVLDRSSRARFDSPRFLQDEAGGSSRAL